MTIDPEYVTNLEKLCHARTDQLRTFAQIDDVLEQSLEAVIKAENLEQAKRITQEALDKVRLIKSNSSGLTQ